ncbi:MAG: group 1 truncated hemoglobin [Planctomycetia bacterium]|nr:group 1 truncated hemoglobin [Planctomycetia bacterium]
MRARIVLAVLFLVGAGTLARGDDKPIDRADLDKRIVMTVYESAVLGTDIFNKGGHAECYRLYQGTLMAVHPLLDHRPKLQANVKTRLERAAKMKAADAAFELRTALDEVQNEIAPSKVAKKALWDRLGGEKSVRVVVQDFIVAAAKDPKVNFDRNGKFKFDDKAIKHLEQMLVELISETTGGPLKYTGKSMDAVHKGMGITDAEFDALAGVLIDVLKKHKVPQAEIDELVKIVAGTRGAIVEKKN